MAGANENFEHLLDAQQKKEAQEAIKKGHQYDTREKAISNTLAKFDVPHDALDYLSKLGEEDQKVKSDLETQATNRTLSGAEINKLEEVRGRLSANQTVATEVIRKLTNEANQRRAEYQAKPFKELKGDIAKLKVGVEATMRELNAARAAPGATTDTIRPFENAYKSAQAKFQEAEDVYNVRSPEELAKDAEDEAEAAEAEYNKRIEGYNSLPVDKLSDKTGELLNNWRDLDAQTSRINRRGTAEEKADHKVKLEAAANKWREANGVLQEKEAAEKKRLDEENENTARSTLTSADIAARKLAVEGNITTIGSDLAAAEAELATAIAGGNAAEIAQKQRLRNQKATELSEAHKTLKLEEDALKKALDRESKDFGSVRSKDTMDIKSWNEYDSLSPEQQAQYLETVLANEDMAGMDFDSIKAKLDGKLPTSFKEKAFYGAEFADRMMSGKVSMKEFPKLAAGNKDLFHMVTERVTSSEQAKALAEKYGTPMEKLFNWAKKDYKWLMILIALIAAAAGPTTMVTGLGSYMLR